MSRPHPPSGVGRFFVLTFALTWLLWLPMLLAGHHLIGPVIGPVQSTLLLALGTAVPSFVALALAARSGGAALLCGLTRWRLPARWYAAVLLIPATLILTAVGLDVLLGGTAPSFPSPGRWPLVAVNFLAVLLIGGPLGEELGWRGYALPRLDLKLNSTAAAVLLGLVWAAWHLPLFLLPGTPQAQLPLVWFVLQTVAFSVLLAWVYRRTGGSLLLVVLLHGVVNTLAGPLRVLPTTEGTLRPYILITLLTVAAALLVSWQGQSGRPVRMLGAPTAALEDR
ncbi:CPBP family intramembrane metalloprotease [Deinococcus detaillensis]|uniref:CPBP family intramembrane metalloprotease n=1 Tax=Deinococcus detaillensis TaxID=2592048 RepID=A0A553UID3_9DEIO|nr:type II CAAX endopeptidase family protein [Deinococcus detaillensis]TSA79942.1 CPBP family intramembrane metalloprotease [Deinococcus detaillensis]